MAGASEYEAVEQIERDEKVWWRGTRYSPPPKVKKKPLDPANYTSRSTVNWGFGVPQPDANETESEFRESFTEFVEDSKEAGLARDYDTKHGNEFESGFSQKKIKPLQRDSKRYGRVMLLQKVKLKRLERESQTPAVLRAIRGLKREALQIYAHDIRGMTAEQIADHFGVTRAAVSNAIDRLQKKVDAEIQSGEFFAEVLQDIGEMQHEVAQQPLDYQTVVFGKRGLPADGHVPRCQCAACRRGEPNFKIDANSVGRGIADALGEITPKQAWRNRRSSHPKEVSPGIAPQGFKPLRQTRHLVSDEVLNERAKARKLKKAVRGEEAARI